MVTTPPPGAGDDALLAFVRESPIRRRAIVDHVRAWSRTLQPGSEVLDVGAGTAPYRAFFDHCRYRTHDWENSVHGGDVDVVGDLESGLTIPGGAFDGVLCTEVIEHTATPGRALAEIRRLLRPGGSLALTVPFVVPLHEEPFDFWRPTSHGLHRTLDHAGFTSIDVRPMTGWFGTAGEALRDYAFATTDPTGEVSVPQRLAIQGAKLSAVALGRWSHRLDRLDRRRALPVGWTVVCAAAASTPEHEEGTDDTR
ncbi:class I SAM-dependent methyltransferase [Nocardioides sp. L-11A]|uniref:class I SAM-dependent methyltransferase n=1 Tax=Nocardioides sp. L-11A TaxID=3043848 RepID=UPI00249A5137|nr:class I SAM-dependent methyltransferase [Nocardioides sp. L-11A]